jgi:anti-sigma factor ChrR (cupin superfamily)
MTRPAYEELAEYVLGSLPDARRRVLETQIAASPELQHDVAELRESFSVLDAQLTKVAPRTASRAALLQALDSADRFSPFVDDLVGHFDLPNARVRELLRQTDDPARWIATPVPGIRLMDFPSGPNAIAAHAGFTTFPKGLEFPYHRHLGPEINYILEGSMLAGGKLYIPGEAVIMETGSSHEFAIPDADTLIAVIHLGFEFVDKPE